MNLVFVIPWIITEMITKLPFYNVLFYYSKCSSFEAFEVLLEMCLL